MRNLIMLTALICAPFILPAQDAKLAQQYFRDGEFEKAAVMYQKLYKIHNNNTYYFDRYIECQLSLERYPEVEKIIKGELKKNPKNIQLFVTYGNLFERQFQEEKAKEQYEKAIKKLAPDQYSVTKLGRAFTNLTKYEYAIRTYEKGGEMLNNSEIFAMNLADLYRQKGDIPKMIENYLTSLNVNPAYSNTLKNNFQRILDSDGYLELQTQLYNRIQENPESIHYPELLTWVFIQRKDYRNAFRQVKALDRRLDENGGRIYQLAKVAATDKDYDSAILAFDYIVENKGTTSAYYIDAKREALQVKRNKVVEGFTYTKEDLFELESAYEGFLKEFGRSKVTASIVAELADLEAFYLNNLPKAITLLNELIKFPGLLPKVQAEGKLSLGDFYLMQDEIWEATLLYSQVDKDFVEDLLGHEARYRNAKLAYFAGDFQWAQVQFDILKASTSKLIANDALDLSVFIMDNLGLDTTDVSLKLYSDADLLIFQNRFEDAFLKLDTLLEKFPEHSLQDDVLYSKAQIFVKKREYDKAIEKYEEIIEKFPEEIRADNALFGLAEIYEINLGNLEKAKELYEKIFLDYSGSTFAVEARKRFRKLRGDDI